MFTPAFVILAGLALLALLLTEVLFGLRVIKLEGRRHWQVHKWLGLTILAVAVAHGLAAIAVYGFPLP